MTRNSATTAPSSDVEAGLSKVASTMSIERPYSSRSRTSSSPSSSTVFIKATLRSGCPPNCRCRCHRTSHARSPGWAKSLLGALFVEYRSLPMLGVNRCDAPLCKSASGSSFHLQYSFPRWFMARVLVASMSWGPLNDQGAAIFLQIPRCIRGFDWLAGHNITSAAFMRVLQYGSVLSTDILNDCGQTLLTVCPIRKRPRINYSG